MNFDNYVLKNNLKQRSKTKQVGFLLIYFPELRDTIKLCVPPIRLLRINNKVISFSKMITKCPFSERS